MARRMWIVSLLMVSMMLFYIGRLAWLQLLPGSAPSARAASHGGWQRLAAAQRQRHLMLDSGRGDFYDRSGTPITGETYEAAAFFPVAAAFRGDRSGQEQLAACLGVTWQELSAKWDALREPIFWSVEGGRQPLRLTPEQAEAIKRLHVPGVKVLPYRNRYLTSFAAKHAIGFTSQHPEWLRTYRSEELSSGKRRLNEQIGGAGLEKSLDALLRGLGPTSVSYQLDARNAPLEGLDVRIAKPVNRYYPLQTMTTLDLELQNRIEAYVDEHGLTEGAVVVLDANNADIVSMVSRPVMQPGAFRSSDGSEWENHAIKATAPGSIFKLVTEAAALETGSASLRETFTCNGEYGKYGLSCWKEGGHGTLTLQEGLAQSCNIAFATVAERLKPSELLRTAEALGLGHQAGWHTGKRIGALSGPLRLLEEEEAGAIYAGKGDDALARQRMLDAVDGGAQAQTGIGQRDVRMSPLQAANLIVTLLNEGRVMQPRLVSEIRYADGQRMLELPAQRAQGLPGRIRPGTARALLRGMEAVVDHGTGRSIRQGLWAVAGKSGTAEATRAGIARNHQWFAGYGPAAKPRYAVAVLVLNQEPGSANRATKLFRGIMDIAAERES